MVTLIGLGIIAFYLGMYVLLFILGISCQFLSIFKDIYNMTLGKCTKRKESLKTAKNKLFSLVNKITEDKTAHRIIAIYIILGLAISITANVIN